jgi:hypothetical protein
MSCAVVVAPTFDRAFAQVMLEGRVRQAEAVSGLLLRPSSHDRGNDGYLAVARALRGGAEPGSHASRLAAASHSSRPSIGIS